MEQFKDVDKNLQCMISQEQSKPTSTEIKINQNSPYVINLRFQASYKEDIS